MRLLLILVFALAALAASSSGVKMSLSSTDFKEGDPIPKAFTCEGDNLSPALEWGGCPAGVRSFALICDDPDAPMGTWIHWVMFNIPGEARRLDKGVAKKAMLPDGSAQGVNSWPKTGYDGPCPPPGKPHRYFFKLYALDAVLSLKESAGKEELLAAMKGHIIGEASLMGTYRR